MKCTSNLFSTGNSRIITLEGAMTYNKQHLFAVDLKKNTTKTRVSFTLDLKKIGREERDSEAHFQASLVLILKSRHSKDS